MVPLVHCSLPVYPSSPFHFKPPSHSFLFFLAKAKIFPKALLRFFFPPFEICLSLIHLLFYCFSEYHHIFLFLLLIACCVLLLLHLPTLSLFLYSNPPTRSSSQKKAQSENGRMAEWLWTKKTSRERIIL